MSVRRLASTYCRYRVETRDGLDQLFHNIKDADRYAQENGLVVLDRKSKKRWRFVDGIQVKV